LPGRWAVSRRARIGRRTRNRKKIRDPECGGSIPACRTVVELDIDCDVAGNHARTGSERHPGRHLVQAVPIHERVVLPATDEAVRAKRRARWIRLSLQLSSD